MAEEETVTYLNVDTMAAARGAAWRAAGELGGTLPESELRTVLVGVFNKVAEVFDRLMAHANEAGVGEFDVAELPAIEDLFDDDELEVDAGREFPPTRSVTFEGPGSGVAQAEADAQVEAGGPASIAAETAAEAPVEPTLDGLKARAKELGLTGVSKLNKDDLAVRVAQAEADGSEG